MLLTYVYQRDDRVGSTFK